MKKKYLIIYNCKICVTVTTWRYNINLYVTWMSPYKGSLLLISNISEAYSAKFEKIRSLGGGGGGGGGGRQ